MIRAARFKTGSVVEDRRRKTWNFLWWENGKRRTKSLGQHPTKTSAWTAAKPLRDALETKEPVINEVATVPTVNTLVCSYRAEKMPKRLSTRRAYELWLKNHIIPKWGNCVLSDLQPRPVELWLEALSLSPKSKAHIRGLLGSREAARSHRSGTNCGW